MTEGTEDSPSEGLCRAAPSTKDVDADAVSAFVEDVAKAGLELHGMMLWRDGAVVAEAYHWPYSHSQRRIVHSLTKSITACAIAMLIDDGRLSLDSRVMEFFPEISVPEDSAARRMTVEHLLTMRTGHDVEVSGSVWRQIETSWVDEFFCIPIVHEPGTKHVYSSAASYILSAIVTRVTGQTIFDFLQPRLFAPLAISDLRWDVGPDGINPGGNGIRCTLADAMKIGILHAQDGIWHGERILPQWWVEAASQPRGAPDYGYHWVVGEDYYAAVGMFVQMVIVYPHKRAVLGLFGAIDGSKTLLPFIQRHIPAALGGGGSVAADRRLDQLLERWTREPPLPSGSGDPVQFAGDWTLDPNELGIDHVTLDFRGHELELQLRDSKRRRAVVATLGGWTESRTSLGAASLHHGYRLEDAPTIAGWRWLSPNSIELICYFVESAFRDRFLVTLHDQTLTIVRSVNINSGPRGWPPLRGRRPEHRV